MIPWLLAQIGSRTSRIDAVHREFAERSNAEAFRTIYLTVVVCLVGIGVIVLLERLQRVINKRHNRPDS